MSSRAPTLILRLCNRISLLALQSARSRPSVIRDTFSCQHHLQLQQQVRTFTFLPIVAAQRRGRLAKRRHRPFDPESPRAPKYLAMTSVNGLAPDTNINHADARKYWEGVEADVDGMLGGFAYVSAIDLRGSKTFLQRLGVLSASAYTGKISKNVPSVEHGEEEPANNVLSDAVLPNEQSTEPTFERVVDCGAGIGRITDGFLRHISKQVDIVEPIQKFAEKQKGNPGIGEIFNVGLEDWTPEKGAYDLIWNQWCLGHLTDTQLVDYLKRCALGLKPGGYIIVKENLSTGFEDLFDDVDSSVTRKETSFKSLFIKAHMAVSRTALQRGLPKTLYPVRMWALQPHASHFSSKE